MYIKQQYKIRFALNKFVNLISVISDLIKFTIVKLIVPIFENCALNSPCRLLHVFILRSGPSLLLPTKIREYQFLNTRYLEFYIISFNAVV